MEQAVSSAVTGPLAREVKSSSRKIWSCRSDELKKIKDQLTSSFPSSLKVVTIVGMGGIGKTTLAKSIFEDVEVSYHFHRLVWITVSQKYRVRNLFVSLLKSMDVSVTDRKLSELENGELEQLIYKNLKGRKFLIVFDDIWNAEIWNEFKRIIPDDNNGSGVILTTRLMEVARDAEPNTPLHFMNCLSDEESWRLLQNEVFVDKPCPSNLVEIGQVISKKCQGLPLAIVVVAGHLSKIDKKEDCWVDVLERLDSLQTKNEDEILDILCWSYNHLPCQLKACFLYMGTFPKNSKILVVRLIRLWSAVGFLTSEGEAQKCLEDLINRNLIMVGKKKYGMPKTCGIHDLLWDLSSRETQKEGHYIFSRYNSGYYQLFAITGDTSHLINLTSSWISPSSQSQLLNERMLNNPEEDFESCFLRTSISFRLLRVLVIASVFFHHFPETITNLVGLRYLELCTLYISGSVSKLSNLETLINYCPLDLPKEIWLLRHLKHLQAEFVTLEIPVSCSYYLQTLSSVSFGCCTQLLFSRIPNLKQLKICDINGEDDEKFSSFLFDLVYLGHLEKLKLDFNPSWGVRRIQQQLPWCSLAPLNLRELTLRGSILQWEDMNILAKLPNIEVLKLKQNAFVGSTYAQNVEGFRKLKVLLLDEIELKYWIAETTHYPILQHLVLRYCNLLEELPSCFGEIPTLESIELCRCSSSAEESAKTIQQEQQSLGNDLQVIVYENQSDYESENEIQYGSESENEILYASE